MRQCSIRSTHWSVRPELRTPQAATATPVRVLRASTGKTGMALREESSNLRNTHRATLTATQADVADQPEGPQCNATLGCEKRNADGREVVQCNADARSGATHNPSCEPCCGRNTIAPSSSICAVQLGGRRVACLRITHSVHSRTVEGAHPLTRSRSGHVNPVVRSSANHCCGCAGCRRRDPSDCRTCRVSPRRLSQLRSRPSAPPARHTPVTSSRARTACGGQAARTAFAVTGPPASSLLPSPRLTTGVVAADRAMSRVRSRPMPSRPRSGSGRAPGVSERVTTPVELLTG
jgi:hypothetical protein